MYCAQPLLPIFSMYFGVSPAHSSFSVSLTTGLLALSILIVGANAQRLPRKGLMGVSLLVSALLTLLASTMPDWGHLLILRALLGIALGVGVLAAVVQSLGLARWPFLVPFLARAAGDAFRLPL